MSIVAEERALPQVAGPVAFRGNGPGGVRLARGEAVPALSPVLAERLADLFGELNGRLVASAVGRLVTYGVPYDRAQDVADDLVQEVWADAARKQRNPGRVLGPEAVDIATARRHLYGEVKHAVLHYLRSPQRVEEAADFDEPRWRSVQAGPLDASQGPLSDRCRELLASLPEQLREAMVERCYGVPLARIAELLGVSSTTAEKLVKRAVAHLQGEAPADRRAARETAAERKPVTLDDLELEPEQRAALEALSAGQREALDQMPEHVRVVLLLRLAGLSYTAITKRTGRGKGKIYDWSVKYACVMDPDRVPDGDGLPEGWLHLAAGLPERHRQAVTERSGGATWAQVAEALGCSKSNATALYASGARALWAAHRNQAARSGAVAA